MDYTTKFWNLSIDWFEGCEEQEISTTHGFAAQCHWHYLLMCMAWEDI